MWRILRPPTPARRPDRGGSFRPKPGQNRMPQPAQMTGPLPTPSPARSLQLLIATAISFPQVLDADLELFARLDIADPELGRVRRAILEAHDSQPSLDREGLRLHLITAGFEGIVARLLGSSIFKGLAFVRADDRSAAMDNWQEVLLGLHEGS